MYLPSVLSAGQNAPILSLENSPENIFQLFDYYFFKKNKPPNFSVLVLIIKKQVNMTPFYQSELHTFFKNL